MTSVNPETQTPTIGRPVALILYLFPAPPHLSGADKALSDFEQKHFTPGTPAADLYQAVLDPTWHGLILALFVFPEQYLAEFAESLRGYGLALVQGTPTMFDASGVPSSYSHEEALRELCIDVGDRTYVFETLSASGRVLRKGVMIDELVKK